jgi:hypothetical protein
MSADNVCSLSPSINWPTSTFVEATANDGSIATVINISISDDEFVPLGALVENIHFFTNNVPAGLTVSINIVDATTATVALTGNALNHENVDDIFDLGIAFTDSIFVSGFADNVTNSTKTDLVVDFDDMVSSEMINNSNNISIYPNPTTGIFTVNGNGITKIEITDITGKIIATSEVNNFDLSNENNGVYFAKVYFGNSVNIQKIILNK